MRQVVQDDVINLEIDQLLRTIYMHYGYDFRGYSHSHIKRRVMNYLNKSGFSSLAELNEQIANSPLLAAGLLQDFSIGVTEMFRDPFFYKYLREQSIPVLQTYPFVKIWVAGCSTGEEVYSLAILLNEEGLEDQYRIYATDFNETALNKAREGIYQPDQIKRYTVNYMEAGGKEDFAAYYTSRYGAAIMNNKLKKNIVWANHNLVTDSVFSEVQMLCCRNVLIYFNKDLQNRVLSLFNDSLIRGGMLCLGTKENLKFSVLSDKYETLDHSMKIFKKKFNHQ